MRFKHWRRRCTDPAVGLALHVLLVVLRLFTYKGMERLSRVLGRVIILAYPRGRKLIAANLAVAFPEWSEARRQRVVREVAANAALTSLEFLWFAVRPDRLTAIVDTSSPKVQAEIDRIRAGQCAVMLTPHLGNWELMGQVMAANGVPFCAVAHRIRNPWVDRIVARVHDYHGMTILPEDGAVRSMVSSLKAGKAVGALIDQNTRPSQGGAFVDFFGLPASSSRAPAALAQKFGTIVSIMACVRENGRLVVHAAKLARPEETYQDDVELTQAIIDACEELIRRWPEQYAWLYARWRYVPDGIPDAVRERYPYYAGSNAASRQAGGECKTTSHGQRSADA